MTLSAYAIKEWLTILIVGLLLAVAMMLMQWWIAACLIVVATFAVALFFRDPKRETPTQRGVVVSPVDGKITSVHDIEHFEPFGGPAVCVRIFISLLDPHIARSPCHGNIVSLVHTPGKHMNAMNPQSLEDNEALFYALEHPIRQYPVAAVRLVAGLFARTILCPIEVGQTVQRGQKVGIIKLGSAAELYLPQSLRPSITLQQGQHVLAGETVIASVSAHDPSVRTTPAPAPGSESIEDEAMMDETFDSEPA